VSFEAFEVHLHPIGASCLCSADPAKMEEVLCVVQAQWPEFHPDEVEIARLYKPLQLNERLLVYETAVGLIQLSARLDVANGRLVLAMWFAYCNPRRVEELTCNMVEWLMHRYQLYCHISADLAPEHQGEPDDVYATEKVRSLLLSSMDYNRRLWQLDAGNGEEAVLRPGDAVARFIAPHLVTR